MGVGLLPLIECIGYLYCWKWHKKGRRLVPWGVLKKVLFWHGSSAYWSNPLPFSSNQKVTPFVYPLLTNGTIFLALLQPNITSVNPSGPFYRPKWQISLPFHILWNYVKSLPIHIPEAWKKDQFILGGAFLYRPLFGVPSPPGFAPLGRAYPYNNLLLCSVPPQVFYELFPQKWYACKHLCHKLHVPWLCEDALCLI